MNDILIPVGVLAGLGLFFGIVLAIAAKAFAVKTDERIEAITELLPGANCGGCGYSGCAQLAGPLQRARQSQMPAASAATRSQRQ